MKKFLFYALVAVATWGTVTVLPSCSSDDDEAVAKSSEAKIVEFTFDSSTKADSIVTIQPVIDETAKTITFSVTPDATAEAIKGLVAVVKVSDKATVTSDPATPDFNNAVTYTVVAEDGTSVAYTASISSRVASYGFDTWVAGVKDQKPDMTFYEPDGWTSSNGGAQLLKGMQYASDYVVMESKDDSHSGSAAKIQTIDSKGGDMMIAKIPKVTTGSLFLGAFQVDMFNTLNSTKFGIPYAYTDKYPVQLKGWYKYKAGTDYYVCEAPYADNCHKATVDASQKDKGTIAVVLYETDAYDTTTWSDCLTGTADTEKNIYTSSRIVAMGSMNVEDQADWKEFTLDIAFKDGKSFDASKKYRFTISCSSSYQGDKFWGAPGSTLMVDDFELVYKNVK